MASPKGEAAKTLAAILMGSVTGGPYGVGRAARAGGRVWNTITRENPEGFVPEDENTRNIRAAQKLADAQVSEPIDFDAGIVYVPGPAQENRMLTGASPADLEAFIRQSEQEHAEALESYMDDPNIPADQAAKLGIRKEQGLAKWWNDHDPRRPLTPSSSCVSSARIGPNGDIYIRFQEGGKEYQYEGSPDPVEASKILKELVGVPGESIGRKVNSWTGSWGKAHTYLPKG